MSHIGTQHVQWEILCSVKVNDLHTAVKYKSPETGLELVHAHVDGPLVHAYCVIAHRCEDNCGIPRVIKHMIWHGSRKFPHSGLLHRIATKCFSVCGEIQTKKDHSSYGFTSVGKEGFSSFLPVFCDHIFNPLLHEAAFITEVYHIETNGHDGGTCFNRMKASENEPDELGMLSIFQTAFGSTSGYSVHHKGISSIFRSQCNLEKVRKFHEKFYHASNCCLIVVGGIDNEELFRALAPVIQNLLKNHRVKPTWTKPWLTEPPIHIPDVVIKQIEYPFPFTDAPVPVNAYVKIGIIGPSFQDPDHFGRSMAMRLILEYLKDPISIALAAAAMSSEKADASMSKRIIVSFTQWEFKESLFVINLENVPMDVVPSVSQLLRKIMLREMKRNIFKMRKLMKIILNFYQRELRDMENTLEVKIAQAVIPDFIYSTQDSALVFERRINSAYTIHNFLSENMDFWKNIIQTCFLDVNWITVVAVPSELLYQKMQEEMSERISWRLEGDNVKYTKRWTHRLKAATKLLSKGPPLEMVNKYPLPNVDSIGLMKILRQDNPLWASDTLCNLYVDDVDTNYAYLTIIMDTTELTLDQRKYMLLFSEAISHAAFIDNFDKFHSAKECQKEVKQDVLAIETFFGLEWMGNVKDRNKFSCGNFSHLFCLRIQMDITKVREGFYWAQMLLWNTKWQSENLKQVCIKLIKDSDELQTQSNVIIRALLIDCLYQTNSTPKCNSLIRQKVFLRQVSEELSKSVRRVSKFLESVRNCLLRPENVTVHLAASLPRMEFHLTENPDAIFAISELFRTTFNYSDWSWEYETKRLANNPDSAWMKSIPCSKEPCNELIFPLANINAHSCLIQVIRGARSYTDPEYPVQLVTFQYFIQQPDGPFYKEIVEPGYAENVEIRINPLEGLIYFEMRGCSDLPFAYARAVDLITRHLLEKNDGEGDASGLAYDYWDNFLLQSAKSSIILKLAELENTPVHTAMSSLAGHYKELTHKNTRQTMDAITKVTMKQVQRIARKYFGLLFLKPNTCLAIVPSDRIYSVIEVFMQRYGKKLSMVPPLEHSFLASFNQ